MAKNIFRSIVSFCTSGSNRSVIAICFLMSTLFWFLIKFSKEYTHYIDYPVEFVNLPVDKYLKDPPVSELQIKVSGYGFNFLKETFSKRSVEVDASKLQRQGYSSNYFWLSQSEIPEITSELKGFSILEINPDTLFLNFSNKTKKSIEVKVPLNLNFKENYVQYGSFKIIPKTIEVFGPSHILDTLSYVYTEVLSQDVVVDDIDVSLQVRLPDELLSARDLQVQVSQEVARFTEINKSVVIQLKNVPKDKELRIKPAKVELSYWVAMKDVDKVKASDFEIYCDYNEVAMTQSSVLNLFLDESKNPSIVQRVKYHPSTVEFVKLN